MSQRKREASARVKQMQAAQAKQELRRRRIGVGAVVIVVIAVAVGVVSPCSPVGMIRRPAERPLRELLLTTVCSSARQVHRWL